MIQILYNTNLSFLNFLSIIIETFVPLCQKEHIIKYFENISYENNLIFL